MSHFAARLAPPLALALLLLAAAACGSGGEMGTSTPADTTASEEDDGPEYPYEIIVQGMLRDTLRGRAEFGRIFDPGTGRQKWVLSMRAGGDVTSGIYLARPDTGRPQTGTFDIIGRAPVGESDTLRANGADAFTLVYRAGMRRSFHSESGTVEFTTATDTLVEGTFQATLEGSASLPGQPPRSGIVTLQGEFRADKATVGFMFGV
jgi:hypothetical protein